MNAFFCAKNALCSTTNFLRSRECNSIYRLTTPCNDLMMHIAPFFSRSWGSLNFPLHQGKDYEEFLGCVLPRDLFTVKEGLVDWFLVPCKVSMLSYKQS